MNDPVVCRWVPSCSAPAVAKAVAFCWWGKDEHLVCADHLAGPTSLRMPMVPLDRVVLDASVL